ncbi:MAG: DUF4252 domain-containing protein [Pseudomonadales bacterium]|nr:DUF4252 domain-containing protein [Pseudomonadales bacterium]
MKTLLICSSLILLTGCMSFTDRSFRPVRDSLTAQMPELILKKEVGIAMGGGMFDFLDVITFNEADLSEIDHLQVAVYTIHPRGGNVDFSDDVFLESLTAKDASLTWDRIVKVKEDHEQVWVYVGMDIENNSLDAMSVFVLEHDELVLINMDGDFNDMIEYALAPARGHRGVYKSS